MSVAHGAGGQIGGAAGVADGGEGEGPRHRGAPLGRREQGGAHEARGGVVRGAVDPVLGEEHCAGWVCGDAGGPDLGHEAAEGALGGGEGGRMREPGGGAAIGDPQGPRSVGLLSEGAAGGVAGEGEVAGGEGRVGAQVQGREPVEPAQGGEGFARALRCEEERRALGGHGVGGVEAGEGLLGVGEAAFAPQLAGQPQADVGGVGPQGHLPLQMSDARGCALVGPGGQGEQQEKEQATHGARMHQPAPGRGAVR